VSHTEFYELAPAYTPSAYFEPTFLSRSAAMVSCGCLYSGM
jgi:hypothetical protein